MMRTPPRSVWYHGYMAQSTYERFSRMHLVGDGCFDWTGSGDGKGYGKISVGGRMLRAHRVSYELFVGPIPDGMTIDHLCRNRGCVKFTHLEAVSLKENVHRGDTVAARNAAKTHCPSGHEYSAENMTARSVPNRRECKICMDRQRREYRARLAAS